MDLDYYIGIQKNDIIEKNRQEKIYDLSQNNHELFVHPIKFMNIFNIPLLSYGILYYTTIPIYILVDQCSI